MVELTLDDIELEQFSTDTGVIRIFFASDSETYIKMYKREIGNLNNTTLVTCIEDATDMMILTPDLIIGIINSRVYRLKATSEEFQLTLNTQLLLGENNV